MNFRNLANALAGLLLLTGTLLLPLQARGAEQDWQYIVRPGEKLVDIARRYLKQPRQWPAIKAKNSIADENRLIPGSKLLIPAAMLRQQPAQATLETVNGKVRWRAGKSAWQDAHPGDKLEMGSSLETATDASALLRLADGSSVLISQDSSIALDTLSLYSKGLMANTRVRLQGGRIEVLANPTKRSARLFQVTTPSAQAVVRGTRFRVAYADGLTHEETLEGVVGVSARGRSVRVAPGQGVLVKTGAAPAKAFSLPKAPEVPGLPTHFEQLPLHFPLPTPAQGQAWLGQISPDERMEQILLSKMTTGSVIAFADLPNGNYVLRLRTVDSNGIHGVDAVHPFTVFARPFPPGTNAPGLNVPGDGAVLRNARPDFSWSSIVGITQYRLQLSSRADFADPLHEITSEQAKWRASSDLPAGTLFWRVASVSAENQRGPWGPISSFTYKPGPGATELGKGALEIESDDIRIKIPPPPDGQYYEAILASDVGLQKIVAQAKSDVGEITLPYPESGTYFLGVRLIDRSDETPGPMAVQTVEIEAKRLWLILLLLLPLAF